MKKHLFTIRWMRKGHEAYPVFEFHRTFDWPDAIPPNDALKCASRIMGTPLEKIMEKHAASLPPDAEEVMRLLPGLHLRCRYSPETMGPYLVPDADNLLSPELLLTWVSYNEDKLKEYRL